MPFSPNHIQRITPPPSSYIIFNLLLLIRESLSWDGNQKFLCSKFRTVCLWKGFFLSGYIVSFLLRGEVL